MFKPLGYTFLINFYILNNLDYEKLHL